MNAKVNLEYGSLHAFDESEGESKDMAHAAARGIIAHMQDNAEINAILEAMDGAMKSELVSAISDIIREAENMDAPEAEADTEEAIEE